MQDNIEENVIALFKQKGYQKNEYLTQQMVRKVFNQHSDALLQMPFKNDMAQELIDQCRQSKLQLTSKSLGEVISNAYQILVKRLNQLGGQNGLVNNRTMLLQARKQKFSKLDNTEQNVELKKSISQEIVYLQDDIKILSQNQREFNSQLYIIEQLFKKYIPISKKRKSYRQNEEQKPNVVPNAKNLSKAFYLTVLGLLLQFFIVQLRPGSIGIVIYLQVLFLLFVGYFNRKAAMALTFTNVVSILLDIIGIVFIQIYDINGMVFQVSQFWYTIKIYVLKIMLILSIIIRIGILMFLWSFIEPPLQKISFTLCKSQFPLNTRLKSGRDSYDYLANWGE